MLRIFIETAEDPQVLTQRLDVKLAILARCHVPDDVVFVSTTLCNLVGSSVVVYVAQLTWRVPDASFWGAPYSGAPSASVADLNNVYGEDHPAVVGHRRHLKPTENTLDRPARRP